MPTFSVDRFRLKTELKVKLEGETEREFEAPRGREGCLEL